MKTMRRFKQQMEKSEIERILMENSTGILSVINQEGYPYPVPLNYVWLEGKIYFHCAMQGEKIDAIKANSRVCFCLVNQDRVIAEKFSTQYKSVIVFGQARLIYEETVKRAALEALVNKYCANFPQRGQQEIKKDGSVVQIVEITIEKVSGKTASEQVMAIQ